MFSIIVPMYNSEKYIKKCLESLLSQSVDDYEILIVDDGSNDSSKNICMEYQRKNGKIKVYSQENGGVSKARNFGISKAKGDYIIFVDSDDWVDNNLLETIKLYIDQYTPDILIYGIKYIQENKVQFDSSKEEAICMEQNQIKEYITNLYEVGAISSSVNKVYKREVLRNSCFDESLKYGEDLKFNMRVFGSVKSIINIPKALYYYNKHENSLTTNIDKQQIREMLSLFQLSKEFFESIEIEKQRQDELLIRHYFEYLYPYYISEIANMKTMRIKEKNMLIQKIINADYLGYIKNLEKKGTFQKLVMSKNSILIIGYCNLLSLIQKK